MPKETGFRMPEVGRSALLASQSGWGMQRPIQPMAAYLHYWNSRIEGNPLRVLGGLWPLSGSEDATVCPACRGGRTGHPLVPACLGIGRSYLPIALRTSSVMTFSSDDESWVMAQEVGHIVPSSSCAEPKNVRLP